MRGEDSALENRTRQKRIRLAVFFIFIPLPCDPSRAKDSRGDKTTTAAAARMALRTLSRARPCAEPRPPRLPAPRGLGACPSGAESPEGRLSTWATELRLFKPRRSGPAASYL